MPTRRRDPVSVPRHLPSSHVRHDYGIDESISRMGHLSNAVLEDQYDAAARSRGKDHQLMRTVNDAIRPMSSDLGTPSRIGRRSQRYMSLPPTARGRSVSPLTSSPSSRHHAKAIVPYTNTKAQRIRMAMTPSPSSLLSNKISDFLRGSSVPPRSVASSPSSISYKSYLDSANPPPPSSFDNARSTVAYKSFICDPSITSPFSTRSSYRPYRGYEPSSSSHLPPSLSSPHTSSYRSGSVPHYDIVVDDEDEEENGDGEGYQVGDYRRKYKSIRDRNPGRSNVLYYSTGTPEGSDEEDEVYVPRSRTGTYDYSRPSGVSSLKLSSYDAPHDGSYESDMAEMYEYIPFGPSRQGILELTRHHDNANDDDDSDYSSASVSIPPSIPSSYTSSSLTQPHVSSVSLIPHSSPSSLSELTAPSSSSSLSQSLAQTPVFESILANTAARAREALRGSTIPYKDASLVLSVEGSALSEDGQNRYGFRYYPPPIPLKGSGLGLDERLLGIVPKASTPADSFLGGYLDRLRNLHSDYERRADKEDDRLRCRSVVPRHIPSIPSYSHQTIHMPIQIAGRAQSVPVSSYRSPLSTGRTHRVDVFPLVETQLKLPKDTFRLPVYRNAEDSPARLSVLDKINIKVTTDLHASRPSVGSRRVRACSVPPVSSQQSRIGTFGARPVYPKVAGIHSPPVVLVSDPYYTNIPASSINACYAGPVVLTESREAPWIVKARAGSVPPVGGVRLVRAGSVPPRRRAVVVDNSPVYQAVGTEGLKAHNPRLIRSLRARSVGPLGPPAGSYGYEYESQGPYRPATLGRNFGSRRTVGALPRSTAYDLDNRIGRLARCMSESRDLDQASAMYPTISDGRQRALARHPRLVFVPTSGIGPSNRAKAAIIGSKMEAEDAGKKKRPRSSYAASKYRGITLDPTEDGIYHNNYHYNNSGALHASRPPLPKPTDRKAIRDLDGFTKPRNLMSWQPLDPLRTPTPKYTSPALRRGRAIIHRYPRPLPPALYVPPVAKTMPKRTPIEPVTIRPLPPYRPPPKVDLDSEAIRGSRTVKIPAYYAAGGDPATAPMSEQRRNIRRLLAKTKKSGD